MNYIKMPFLVDATARHILDRQSLEARQVGDSNETGDLAELYNSIRRPGTGSPKSPATILGNGPIRKTNWSTRLGHIRNLVAVRPGSADADRQICAGCCTGVQSPDPIVALPSRGSFDRVNRAQLLFPPHHSPSAAGRRPLFYGQCPGSGAAWRGVLGPKPGHTQR